MERFVSVLVKLMRLIGGCALAGMMFLTCFDVVLRAFGRPLTGVVEISGFLATMAIACALPYTHVARGHVGVDLLVRKLSPRGQAIMDLATCLVSLSVFCLVSWQAYEYAKSLKQSGEVSLTLGIPMHVVVYVVGAAFAVFSLTILVDVVGNWRKAVQE